MLISILLLIFGLLLVWKGADFLVEGASSLAKRLSIPEIVIGLTIVAFGTSAPELAVNLFASIQKNNEVALGNVIGSNIFNLLLILGISGLIRPLKVQKNSILKEVPFSFIAVVVLFFLANDGVFFESPANNLSRLDGLIFLAFFGYFLYYAFKLTRNKSAIEDEVKVLSLSKTWIFIVMGFAGLFIGGKLVVDQAVIIAKALHVSDKLIALTIVAGGTSIPELATSAAAAYKKKADIAIGNIVGSNIFNIFFILGLSSVISPITYPTTFNFDVYVLMAGTVLLVAVLLIGEKHKLTRWEASVLLIAYVVYTVFIILRK